MLTAVQPVARASCIAKGATHTPAAPCLGVPARTTVLQHKQDAGAASNHRLQAVALNTVSANML